MKSAIGACRLLSFRDDERGVTAMEYGLIASLVAVVLISALTKLGTSLSGTFSTVSAHL